MVESPDRRDRYRTWLHINTNSGAATTTDGWRIPQSLARLILCDCDITPVWERDGVPFSVGRSQRIVPDRTRRIIERRDRGCRVPGCTADRFVQVHHIVHCEDGGSTDTPNLICLCPRHHRLHHKVSSASPATPTIPTGSCSPTAAAHRSPRLTHPTRPPTHAMRTAVHRAAPRPDELRLGRPRLGPPRRTPTPPPTTQHLNDRSDAPIDWSPRRSGHVELPDRDDEQHDPGDGSGEHLTVHVDLVGASPGEVESVEAWPCRPRDHGEEGRDEGCPDLVLQSCQPRGP